LLCTTLGKAAQVLVLAGLLGYSLVCWVGEGGTGVGARWFVGQLGYSLVCWVGEGGTGVGGRWFVGLRSLLNLWWSMVCWVTVPFESVLARPGAWHPPLYIFL